MANHSATKKSARQTPKLTERNRAAKSQLRTVVKNVDAALAEKNPTSAKEAFRLAQKALFKAVTKGLIRKATASRKVSRLHAQLKAIGGK